MPLVYEINTRCWLRDLSSRERRPINLSNVPESEFAEWQRLGISHLWLMGVWSSGPRSRAIALAVDDLQKTYGCSLQTVRQTEIVGSPYAISEYRVARQLGGSKGLQKFRAKLHQHGMKLLLDFVPNHVGLDYPWLKERPELFVQSAENAPGCFEQETVGGRRFIAHGRDPFFPPWADTAQLDYRNLATHEAMLQQLLRVAEQCDGVRCDMAMLVLNDVFAKTWKDIPPLHEMAPAKKEFWSEAIRTVRQNFPRFLFVAEAYWGLEERLQALGFDFTYNKELYDDIVRHDAAAVQRRLLNATPEFLARSVNFLENHDERRIASVLSEAEHRAAAALVLSLSGCRLLHEGQLSGATFRSPVQLLCRPSEPVQVAIRDFYERLLATLKRLPLENGICRIAGPVAVESGSAENVILIFWRAGDGEDSEFWLVVVNLGSQAACVIAPAPPGSEWNAGWAVEELLSRSDGPVELADAGIRIAVSPFAVRILRCEKRK